MSTQLFNAVCEEDLAIPTATLSDRGMLENEDDWSPQKDPKRILAKSDDLFYVKGPMGKGL